MDDQTIMSRIRALMEEVAEHLTGRSCVVRWGTVMDEPTTLGESSKSYSGNAIIGIRQEQEWPSILHTFLHETAHIQRHFDYYPARDDRELLEFESSRPIDHSEAGIKAYLASPVESACETQAEHWQCWAEKKLLEQENVESLDELDWRYRLMATVNVLKTYRE